MRTAQIGRTGPRASSLPQGRQSQARRSCSALQQTAAKSDGKYLVPHVEHPELLRVIGRLLLCPKGRRRELLMVLPRRKVD
jgi:hypothetical protein